MASEMSFLEHLDELRRRLIWSVVSIAAAFAGCWMFSGQLYDLASAPTRSHPAVTLSISRPQDIFSLHVRVTMVAAIFLSAPLVLTQAWLFISPGLYPHERRYAIPFVLFASVLIALYVAGLGVAWLFGRRRVVPPESEALHGMTRNSAEGMRLTP